MKLAILIAAFATLGIADAGPKPKPEGWPKLVTQAGLGELARAKFPLAELVDAKHGLAVIHHQVDSGADDFKGVVSSTRLCGAELAKQVAGLQASVVAAYRHSDLFACHNRPGPAYCRFNFQFEYTVVTYLLFRPDDGGDLHLDAVLFVDGGSMSANEYQRQRVWVADRLTKLRSTECDGSAAVAPAYASWDQD